MKKLLISLQFVFVLAWQVSAQCPFDNTFILDATPPACPGTFTVGCMNGGEYVTANLIAGNTYTFSTCGGTAIDTELTLYNASGTTVLASNDDDCGVQSTITYVPGADETVNLLVDEFPCSNSGACIDLVITCAPPVQSGNGCNDNITICTPGLAGPFGFNTPGAVVSTCLDFFGPNYAYIVLYITQSGPLEMEINGDAGTGFMDVAIFDVPPGVDPCTASENNANELGCNYALGSDGCNQFGNSFPCPSFVPSPNVTAGDVVIIVVENWSGTSTSFTMDLAPPPAAQTGPPDPAINPAGPFCDTDPAFQMTALNGGGDWTGTGISTTGLFNPGTAGIGTFSINYSLGAPPCQAASSIDVSVINCATCLITNMTANVGACNPVPGDYETTGTVEFTTPPGTGQLIIEDCNGNQEVFNAPFVSPINYTITGQTPDGAACDITAYFTDDALCTQNIPYAAPMCLCNMDSFTANIGLCDQLTDTYSMSGDAGFTSAPVGGTLVIEVDNGTTVYDTIINPPFVSPQTWSISGIPSDGSATTVTVYFTSDLGCTNTILYNAPTSCACTADIGTFSANVTGDSPNTDVLCFGDALDIASNNDWVGPGEMFNPPGPAYTPGVSWLMYSCAPTVALTPNLIDNVPDDPCFLGLISDTDMNDVNDLGWINAFPPGTFTDNIIYWVPITMYSQANGTYSYVNGTMPCYELGAPFPVQYLPEFTFSDVEDCIAGTATVTLNGGLPELDGSNFTASNLLPGTASFANTTATDGGTITVNGLNGGEMWSFTVDDGNGCPYTIAGGPFPPLEDPAFSYTGGVWCTNDPNQNTTLTGTPGGTYTAAPAGLSLNSVTGQINTTTSTPGTYDVTYTTPGTCFDFSTVTVTINPEPTVDPVADQTICEADNFVDINFTGTVGTTFDWTNDNINIGQAASGTGDILSFVGATLGAQEVANFTITPSLNGCVGNPQNFILTVDQQEDATFTYPAASWCTTEAPAAANVTGTAGGAFTVTPVGLTINAVSGQITPSTSTPGTYDVTYTTAGVCNDALTLTINIAATPTVDPVADQTVCEGLDFALIDFTGSAGTVFDWVNDNTNIGLGALGADDIPEFTSVTLGGQELANITVTPSAGTCVGTPQNFILTVNPQEDASFTYPAPQAWCTSDVNQLANVTGTAGGVFTSSPAGLTINAASGQITPSTSTPGTYDVTYTTAGICNDAQIVTIDVYAVPTVNPITDQTVCVGDDFVLVAFTGTGAPTFDWANDNVNIGLGAIGAGDIAAFTGATSGGTEVANITVTPSTLNCTGAQETFVLTVNDLDNSTFDYPSGLVHCQTGTDPTTNITGMAGGTFTYVVNAGGPTLDLDGVTGTVTLATSDLGTYDITYNTATSGGSLCPQTATVTLTVTDSPVADFTLGIYCSNEADPLPTLINGGVSGAFSSTPGITIDGLTGTVDLDASIPGTYTVTNDVNIAGCALATYDDDITINGLPDATISGSVTICPTDPLPDLTVDFTAGVADWTLTYNVDGVANVITTSNDPYIIASAADGVYDLVSVEDGNGCINTLAGQAIIDFHPVPVLDLLVNQYQCEGADLLIQTFNVNPVGSILNWTNTSGIDVGFGMGGAGDIGNFTAVNGTGVPLTVNIDVTPTSVNGCLGVTESFIVTINPLPIVSFTGGPLSGCEPLTVNFTNTTTPNSQNCVWDFGNGNVVNDCGPVSNVYMAGDFDVTLTVTSAEGCVDTDTYGSYVNVSPQPVALFSYAPQQITVEDPIVTFTNSSINADNYVWNFGDNSINSTVTDPIHLFPDEPSDYTVTLWAYNSAGTCYDSVQQIIPIKDILIYYVPNIMTPDGDQFNESFKPIFTSGYDMYDYHLTIFNRWGEIIFESYDTEYGWNGHYGDGGLVQDGVYIWQIDFKESMSDRRHIKRGHVTVLK